MKFLFEFFPLIVFLAGFIFYDIYVATGAMIICMTLQMGWLFFRKKPITKLQKASYGLLLLLGGVTLLLRNEMFVQLKPTAFYWLVSGSLLFSMVFLKKNPIKALFSTVMGEQASLPEPIWNRLIFYWIVFFAFLGGANLFVVQAFSLEFWVYFKIFGVIGLFAVFLILQGIYISKHLEKSS